MGDYNTLYMDLQFMKILIVDDEEVNVLLLKGILQRAGFTQFTALRNSSKITEHFLATQPDLILLDLHMPQKDGFEILAELAPYLEAPNYLPVLMLTADDRPENRQRALSEGARDFLPKPFDSSEVVLRVRNLLEARYFHKQLQQQNERLEKQVTERTQQLEGSQIEMLVRLAKAAEYRDEETGEHTWRVAHTCSLLARELGLGAERADMLLRAARLHDVGKIAIPDGILLKPTKLTPEEFSVVKTHTTVGAKLLSGGQSPLMKLAELIALNHHERFDGSGYPQGLQGQKIPIEGRIMAVADTFDALTHDRIHRKAWSVPDAVVEIESQRGKQFDPAVVDAFMNLLERGEIVTTMQDAA